MTKDMMPNFSLFQPTTVNDAISLLSKYEENSWKLSGGQDSYDWFKDRAKNPEVIVDLNEITELKGITEKEEYIEIGAPISIYSSFSVIPFSSVISFKSTITSGFFALSLNQS